MQKHETTTRPCKCSISQCSLTSSTGSSPHPRQPLPSMAPPIIIKCCLFGGDSHQSWPCPLQPHRSPRPSPTTALQKLGGGNYVLQPQPSLLGWGALVSPIMGLQSRLPSRTHPLTLPQFTINPPNALGLSHRRQCPGSLLSDGLCGRPLFHRGHHRRDSAGEAAAGQAAGGTAAHRPRL